MVPPPQIPEKRIASNFDWRPYIEFDEKMEPEKRQVLEQALDILAKYHPSFPDTLKRSCSPHIMAEHEKLIESYLGGTKKIIRNVSATENEAKPSPSFEIKKLKLCAKDNQSSHFQPIEREVNTNIAEHTTVRLYTTEGQEYQDSVAETLEHEIGHAADPRVYSLTAAQYRMDNSPQASLAKKFAPIITKVAKMLRETKVDDAYLEDPLIAQSNANWQNGFKASKRLEQKMTITTESGRKKKIKPHTGEFDREAGELIIAPPLSDDVAFPLPILTAATVEAMKNPITPEQAREIVTPLLLKNPALLAGAAVTETCIIKPLAYGIIGAVNGVKAIKNLGKSNP